MRDVGAPAMCELCEAARSTEWFHEDDLCWVAECESCFVPMVVWKHHDPDPPEEIRVVMLNRLAAVVDEHFEMECWFDDNMRSIPHHYHAHARPRGGFFGHGLRRRPANH
jgi:hypothetical protein